jgi:hypothetical protein
MTARTKRPKTTRAAREKVRAPRRQSTDTKVRVNISTNDAYVELLIRDLGEMIEGARHQVAIAANASLTTLYWQVGRRVRAEVLEGRRAEYGEKLVATLGRQLQSRYGRSFGENLPGVSRAIRTAPREAERTRRACGIRTP